MRLLNDPTLSAFFFFFELRIERDKKEKGKEKKKKSEVKFPFCVIGFSSVCGEHGECATEKRK